jgi:hypothetical protein
MLVDLMLAEENSRQDRNIIVGNESIFVETVDGISRRNRNTNKSRKERYVIGLLVRLTSAYISFCFDKRP